MQVFERLMIEDKESRQKRNIQGQTEKIKLFLKTLIIKRTGKNEKIKIEFHYEFFQL